MLLILLILNVAALYAIGQTVLAERKRRLKGPDRSTHCPRCKYDWSHASTDCCPECGLGRNEPVKREWVDRDQMLPFAGWPIAFVPLLVVVALSAAGTFESLGSMLLMNLGLGLGFDLILGNAFVLVLVLVHASIVERCVSTQLHATAIVTVALLADAIAMVIMVLNIAAVLF